MANKESQVEILEEGRGDYWQEEFDKLLESSSKELSLWKERAQRAEEQSSKLLKELKDLLEGKYKNMVVEITEQIDITVEEDDEPQGTPF